MRIIYCSVFLQTHHLRVVVAKAMGHIDRVSSCVQSLALVREALQATHGELILGLGKWQTRSAFDAAKDRNTDLRAAHAGEIALK